MRLRRQSDVLPRGESSNQPPTLEREKMGREEEDAGKKRKREREREPERAMDGRRE